MLALGNFDGLHRGHRKILERVCRVAGERSGTAVVMTFDPHPPRVVRAVLTAALGGLVMAAPVGVPVAGATGPGPARDAGPPLARIAGADPVPLLRRADAASSAAISERPVARPNTHVAPTIGTDSSPTVWLVRTGDSFWRIAQSQLTARDPAHAEPTASQIVGYWRLLIAQNRDRLKVRDDADLLYPGQRLVIPPLDP